MLREDRDSAYQCWPMRRLKRRYRALSSDARRLQTSGSALFGRSERFRSALPGCKPSPADQERRPDKRAKMVE